MTESLCDKFGHHWLFDWKEKIWYCDTCHVVNEKLPEPDFIDSDDNHL